MILETFSDYVWLAALVISLIAFVALLYKLAVFIYSGQSSRDIYRLIAFLGITIYGLVESVSYFVGWL